MLTVGSLFAGIGGFDLAFERAGMTCAWQAEIDGKCNQVLAHHWPDVPRYGDVRDVGKHNLRAVDVICGGYPCQDHSVAGKREGLAGKRSGLWFEFHRILAELKPRWVVIENVPGLLSSDGGRDFATVLQGLAEIGYLSAWRILDAQYFGVAQRRRRVFIVGSLGDGRCAEVLFEPQGSAWDPPPSREAGARVAKTIARGPNSSGYRLSPSDEDFVMAFDWQQDANHSMDVVSTLSVTRTQAIAYQCHSNNVGPMGTLRSGNSGLTGGVPFIAWHENQQGKLTPDSDGIAKALRAGASHSYQGIGVRRLTPVECERLQGFPDNWTAVNGMSDSARYRQLGNAVAVPVVEWMGRRIVNLCA